MRLKYLGPRHDIGDAWAEKEGDGVFLVWQPTDEERDAIATGSLVRMGIYGMHPIPPVSLEVTNQRALSDAGADLRDRAARSLKALGVRGPESIPAGWWIQSEDVWEALQREGALDPAIEAGVPTLLGRPLMVVESLPTDTLEYELHLTPEARS